MTLPTREEQEEINRKRPGDQVIGAIRPDIDRLLTQAAEYRSMIVAILSKDSAWDKALANAMDHFGAVLEYQGQEDGTSPPEFDGARLMKIFGRISTFKFVHDIAKVLGLEGEPLAMALRAEAERIWEKPRMQVPANQAAKVDPGLTPEMTSVLGSLSRYMRDNAK